MLNKLIDIKDVILKNNCPECFSTDGLRLKFKQKLKENQFYKSITEDIETELHCKTCNTVIYPVQWTENIERVVIYHKKVITPITPSTSLKKVSWLILFGVLSLFVIVTVAAVYAGK